MVRLLRSRAADGVPVDVDVGEFVVGPDLLELGEAREQRPVVPEADVLDGEAVALEGRRRQAVLGGEVLLLDHLEPVRLARHADVVLDVRPLGDQLVGRDLEALEQRRPDAQAPRPHHTEDHQARHQEAPPRPRDLEDARDRAEEGQRRERAEGRQRRVDVGVRGAEHHAAGREDQLVAVEPEPQGAKEQEDRTQSQEVRARARRQPRPLGGQHQAPQQDVGRHAQEQRADDEGHRPPVEKAPERQPEDEEGEVLAEEGVRGAEGRGVDIAQHQLPGGARAQAGEHGDHRDHRQEESPDQRLEDRPAGQPELVVELPEDVRRRRPGRGP